MSHHTKASGRCLPGAASCELAADGRCPGTSVPRGSRGALPRDGGVFPPRSMVDQSWVSWAPVMILLAVGIVASPRASGTVI